MPCNDLKNLTDNIGNDDDHFRNDDDDHGDENNDLPPNTMQAIIVNGIESPESDFDFSSDDDEEEEELRRRRQQRQQNDDDRNSQPYRYSARYQLISQNEVRQDMIEDDMDDDEDEEEEGETRNREIVEDNITTNDGNRRTNREQSETYFPHNYIVQWIETDEPLFDRNAFEAQQRREQPARTSNQETNEGVDEDKDSTTNNIPNNSSPQSDQASASTSSSQNDEANRRNRVQLDDEKINKIKGLMSTFQLPNTNVPRWAHEISDDTWKSHLNKFLITKKDS